jgi:hypothetical protein
MLSEEGKTSLDDIIQKANIFNTITNFTPPDKVEDKIEDKNEYDENEDNKP